MKGITRYYKKIYSLFFSIVFAGCVLSLFSAPLMEKIFKQEIVEKFGYIVVVNGKELGQVSSPEEAKQAYNAARLQMNKDGVLVYTDTELEIYKTSDIKSFSTLEAMTSDIFTAMLDSEVTTGKKEAYTIRIEDYVVTLASKEDVITLFEMIKQDYDKGNEFQVSLPTNEDGTLTVKLNKATVDDMEQDVLSATLDGTVVNILQKPDNPDTLKDGLFLMGYAEDITIIPTAKNDYELTSVEDAYAAITKSREEKQYHTVVAGDSLYGICDKYDLTIDELLALNPDIKINSMIHVGDKLVILVPTKEVNPVRVDVVTYQEKFNLPTIYRDNNSMYIGVYNTVSPAKAGYREVKALITYENGVEVSRKIIVEEVIEEAVAAIVERGTVTPPTYINPFYGWAPVTSAFGYRTHPVTGAINSFHTGVDFGVSNGTPMLASRAGTVIRAAWMGGYGYCVDVQHSDGVVTRYAHLSSMNVYVGQYVSQGQVIARSGATGQVTGPHLHFEIRINGGSTPVDPLKYLNR